MLSTFGMRMIEVCQLDAVFATQLLDLATQTINAIVDIVNYAVFLQLHF